MLYSFCTKSKERILHFLVQLHLLCWAETELWSVEGFRERPPRAAPKGNAKTLRQKDRIRTTLRKVRVSLHTKGATGSLRAEGNLSGQDGGKRIKGSFCLFFCLPGCSLSPSLYASARRAVQINQYLIIFYRRNTHELRQNL